MATPVAQSLKAVVDAVVMTETPTPEALVSLRALLSAKASVDAGISIALCIMIMISIWSCVVIRECKQHVHRRM